MGKGLKFTERLRLSEDDKMLLNRLRQLRVKPSSFLRQAFREKIKRDMPALLKEEQKRKEKQYCPF